MSYHELFSRNTVVKIVLGAGAERTTGYIFTQAVTRNGAPATYSFDSYSVFLNVGQATGHLPSADAKYKFLSTPSGTIETNIAKVDAATSPAARTKAWVEAMKGLTPANADAPHMLCRGIAGLVDPYSNSSGSPFQTLRNFAVTQLPPSIPATGKAEEPEDPNRSCNDFGYYKIDDTNGMPSGFLGATDTAGVIQNPGPNARFRTDIPYWELQAITANTMTTNTQVRSIFGRATAAHVFAGGAAQAAGNAGSGVHVFCRYWDFKAATDLNALFS